MVRTQIYITGEEQTKLRSMAHRSGRKQSELIREAIDAFLLQKPLRPQQSLLQKGRGIWKDRNDSEFQTVRRELNKRITR